MCIVPVCRKASSTNENVICKKSKLMPAVSVVIPSYNHGRYLDRRIESVLNQSFEDFEAIILDDASTDNSNVIIKKWVARDSRITYFPSDKNSGSTFIQWNRGVRMAKADLVWIAESDDTAAPDFLHTMVHVHNTTTGVALAFSQSNRMNDAGNITGTWKGFTDDLDREVFNQDFIMNGMEFIKRFLVHKNVIPNASGVVFKKSVYDEVHGADERLRTNSDWLTWLKMLLGREVAFVSAPLNNFRYHERSVIASLDSDQRKDYKEQYDLSMRKLFDVFCNNSEYRLPERIRKVNRKYQSFDYGKKGIDQFQKGHYGRGLINIVRASSSPNPTLGYFRKLIKTNKRD
jgi:glycosyltransferase involved in cell wall biosynthesis